MNFSSDEIISTDVTSFWIAQLEIFCKCFFQIHLRSSLQSKFFVFKSLSSQRMCISIRIKLLKMRSSLLKKKVRIAFPTQTFLPMRNNNYKTQPCTTSYDRSFISHGSTVYLRFALLAIFEIPNFIFSMALVSR